MKETCAICGCELHRGGDYAKPTVKGRSHATEHHFVAERFFGRSSNRRGTKREPIFKNCPWSAEGETVVFCYECHEELIHNPVFLPEDIRDFAELLRARSIQAVEKGLEMSKRTLKGATTNYKINVLRFGSRPALRGVISFSTAAILFDFSVRTSLHAACMPVGEAPGRGSIRGKTVHI